MAQHVSRKDAFGGSSPLGASQIMDIRFLDYDHDVLFEKRDVPLPRAGEHVSFIHPQYGRMTLQVKKVTHDYSRDVIEVQF
jgi:hypothetical protein